MMLKRKVGALLITAVALLGADFQEGVNYTKLDQPLNVEKNTIVKVFSFTCPFCYKYDKAVTEPVITQVLKDKPEASFEVWHLYSKGKYGQQGSNLMAVARARDIKAGITSVFDKHGLLKKMKFTYYKAYHDKNQRWDSGEDDFYKAGFEILGISSKADFEKEVASPEVQELLKRWEPAYPIAKIQGIPAFVVNGKYLLKTQAIKSRDYMVELVEYLLKK
ncbi:thiol:disulfide interchange protein DsbA/DsbL [Halarcobacter ebronensis]|uniref:Thiol:disulfide interchange protein DsbA n=1 Tax=Halarcobacter ebronensis TaxID=1462615 RepID=A0A4Q1A9F9_9BACT|nr:thiol:disulfide interchange protein DsbA/DsbL [Halarcobacter ebronensis]QKF81216.1 protein disulfide oxidoreductase [Halarcobacter ebronensis]QKF83120.1 protein disulfide oxidoreductase [Halarcobacter ebronensis]RXJ99816.1 thiol:disulfide interchange protein [Halarcobacter ebronensis]